MYMYAGMCTMDIILIVCMSVFWCALLPCSIYCLGLELSSLVTYLLLLILQTENSEVIDSVIFSSTVVP